MVGFLEASVLDIYVQNFSHKPPACAGPEPAPLGLVVNRRKKEKELLVPAHPG